MKLHFDFFNPLFLGVTFVGAILVMVIFNWYLRRELMKAVKENKA